MQRTLTFILILFISRLAIAQSVVDELDTYMLSVRTGSFRPVPNRVLSSNEGKTVLTALPTYQSDSLLKIRSKAYYIAKVIGQQSTEPRVIKLAVSQLITGIQDEDSGILGNTIEALIGFSASDFTKQQKQQILNQVVLGIPHLESILKLVGYLEIQESKSVLQEIATSTNTIRVRWAARLALARMGDQSSVDYLLTKLEKASIDDNFMYDFAPDLVYTRNPAIYEYLETIVQDKSKNCHSPNPDSNKKMVCGYRAMELLAKTIESYPIPVDEFGELESDDYPSSLDTLRSWLTENESYRILKDSY